MTRYIQVFQYARLPRDEEIMPVKHVLEFYFYKALNT